MISVDRRIPNKPERELQLAKSYWREKIQPYIAGRKLQGAEFFVAAKAHTWLTMMAKLATHWNESEEGKKSPIPVQTFPEWGKEEFNAPEEFCANENLKPEILAGIAASVMNKGETKLTPVDAIRNAHELFTAANQFINTMPPKQGTGTIDQVIGLFHKRITFEEIIQSNASGNLPLLPPDQTEKHKGHLTMTGLRAAVKRFLEKYNPPLTEEEFNNDKQHRLEFAEMRNTNKNLIQTGDGSGMSLTYLEWQNQNHNSISIWLKNNHISLQVLAALRWDRFKSKCERERIRALKKNLPKSKKLKAQLPMSAASSPITVGKR